MTFKTLRAGISIDRARKDVETIALEIPHRAAGSDNGRRMAEYSRDVLLAAGVSAQTHEFPAIVSFPEAAEFSLTSTGESFVANTMGHSTETGPDGVVGRLIYVGSGAFEDYEGIDVTGAIILTELSYSPARHEKQRIAAIKGAIGAVMMNWGLPDNAAVPMGSVKPAWGVPTPETIETEMATIPCIGISRVDGLRLKEMALAVAGAVEVKMVTHVENGWRPVQITVGEIGAETGGETDDFVLLGGHQDSWPGQAATDNATGNACIMELARVLNAHRSELRRGVVLGFWSAHETGTMAGSSWFADQEWQRLREHAVAYLQIDQPGCIGTTTRWGTSSNAELKAFHEKTAAPILGDRPQDWRRAAKNGDSSFFGIGVPGFIGQGGFTPKELEASALASLGWWHHSIENNLDKVDWEWLETHLEVYAAWMWELCTAPILPFTFTPVAAQMNARLKELAEAGREVDLCVAIEAGQRFAAAASRFDDVSTRLSAGFDGTEKAEAKARKLNTCMKRLSRILVPLQSSYVGKYGQDMYGFTPQTTMIPVLYDLPKLAALPDGEDKWMLRTRMFRERNKVVDGFDGATQLIADTLSAIGEDA